MMLMRTDPFRDLDRLTQQILGTTARPAVMPMDAWREDDRFVVEFDLPGVSADSLDLDVEKNTLTVHAERPALDENREMVAAERPRGVFSRQLFLGENLDADKIEANYAAGVLRLTIPVAERAKPARSRSAVTVMPSRRRSTPEARVRPPHWTEAGSGGGEHHDIGELGHREERHRIAECAEREAVWPWHELDYALLEVDSDRILADALTPQAVVLLARLGTGRPIRRVGPLPLRCRGR